MKIKVEYTDETTETFDTLLDTQKGILETVAGCDFAANVQEVLVVDDEGNEVASLECRWAVYVNAVEPWSTDRKLQWCSRCTKPIGNLGMGVVGWCEACKKTYG